MGNEQRAAVSSSQQPEPDQVGSPHQPTPARASLTPDYPITLHFRRSFSLHFPFYAFHPTLPPSFLPSILQPSHPSLSMSPMPSFRTATTPSPSSRTHAASLLPVHAHSPALLALVAVQVDPEILRQSFSPSYNDPLFHLHLFLTERMASFVIRLVQPYNYGLLTPPSTPPSPAAFPLANLIAFIDNIMTRSRGTFATLLVARIYLQRLRSQLPYYRPAGSHNPNLIQSHVLNHIYI